ncbi:MAG: hypothetical protein DRH37_05330 [Deltaproteobacteria bacterium]|nr:MAG: hypothetical protein DRH37_05330 [Deltaproteobacteria bacterium]
MAQNRSFFKGLLFGSSWTVETFKNRSFRPIVPQAQMGGGLPTGARAEIGAVPGSPGMLKMVCQTEMQTGFFFPPGISFPPDRIRMYYYIRFRPLVNKSDRVFSKPQPYMMM